MGRGRKLETPGSKIVEGSYIHHCVGIHQDVVPVLYEACKYIGVKPDLYDDVEQEVLDKIRSYVSKCTNMIHFV